MNKKILMGVALGAAVIALVTIVLVRNARIAAQETPTWSLNEGLLTEVVTEDGVEYAIPPARIYEAGGKPEDYSALTSPEMTTIANMDGVLGDEVFGVDVEVDGVHRYYPFQILNWHYVVNDSFGAKQLAITHDVLTGATAVYETTSALMPTGLLYDNAMLLRDADGTMWWPTRGVSVAGELGKTLTMYPSEVMSWADWKKAYPNSAVLSDETGVARDYARHPYGGYDNALTVYYPINHNDVRISGPKWQVHGVAINGEEMAFARNTLAKIGVTNETLGGRSIVGIYDEDLATVRVFNGFADKQSITLAYDAEEDRITDNETGSVWSATGVAISGTLRGTVLEEIPTQPMFWFAWASAYPETKIAAEAALSEDSSNTNAGD